MLPVIYPALVREFMSVSTNSRPDRLGYRLLKLASQSSSALPASPGPTTWSSAASPPAKPPPAPVRSTCGLGGATGFCAERGVPGAAAAAAAAAVYWDCDVAMDGGTPPDAAPPPLAVVD